MDELSLRGPVHAFVWAEEFASRPAVKSIFATYGMPRRGNKIGPEYHELLDIAHTITAQARGIEPVVARDTFLVCHAEDAGRREDLRAVLVNNLAAGWPKRDHARLAALADMAITEHQVVRRRRLKRWLPWARYAKAMGVRRQRIADSGWMDVIGRARTILSTWYGQAVDDLDAALRERDVL